MPIKWKILKTGLSGSSMDKPSMWIDQYGVSHCCWLLSGELKYARFMGFDWECLGQNVSDSIEVSIYKSCVALNDDRNPLVMYKDQDGIWVSEWNGSFWEDKMGGAISENAHGATIIGQSPILSFLICDEDDGRYLKCFRYVSESSWEEEGNMKIPPHENDEYDLVSFLVGEDYYLFWKMSDGVNHWIGHSIYDFSEKSFYGTSNYEIKSSKGMGDFSLRSGQIASSIRYSTNMFWKVYDEEFVLCSSSSSSSDSSASSFSTESSPSSQTLGP